VIGVIGPVFEAGHITAALHAEGEEAEHVTRVVVGDKFRGIVLARRAVETSRLLARAFCRDSGTPLIEIDSDKDWSAEGIVQSIEREAGAREPAPPVPLATLPPAVRDWVTRLARKIPAEAVLREVVADPRRGRDVLSALVKAEPGVLAEPLRALRPLLGVKTPATALGNSGICTIDRVKFQPVADALGIDVQAVGRLPRVAFSGPWRPVSTLSGESAVVNLPAPPAREPVPVPAPMSLRYPFPLRRDLVIDLAIPPDITHAEVERLANFLHALVLP